MMNSSVFYEAVKSGDFRAASSGVFSDYTAPGVTTMWIGTLSRAIWNFGRDLDLWDEDAGTSFFNSSAALNIAQLLMAAATAALIGVLVLLLIRWVGRGAAAVAGVILATEPFLVAHGAVLHTDELLALFGVAALVATALAFGVPENNAWAGRRRAAVVAGALYGGAWLTKVTALMFLPAVLLLGSWAFFRGVRQTRRGQQMTLPLMAMARVSCWWVLAAVVVIVAAYPALWVSPISELAFIRRSASMATEGHLQFFLGEITLTAGPLYYFVALPLRTTPWFLLGSLAAGAGLWLSPATRRLALALLCMGGPALLVLSSASKQFDRYGLGLLVLMAIAVGVAVSHARWLSRAPSAKHWAKLAGLTAIVAAGNSLLVAPWGLAYFNPALGGAGVADDAVLVGWSEGLERAGRIIARREEGRCTSVTISSNTGAALVFFVRPKDLFPCGRLVAPTDNPKYVVVYVNERQRTERAVLDDLVAGRRVIGRVEKLGVTYAEVYGPRPR